MASVPKMDAVNAYELTADEIDDARNLLWRVYSQELGWMPVAENPSNQRIEKLTSGKFGLVDDFDTKSIWLGVRQGARLVGCLRMIADSEPEVTRYRPIPNSILADAAGYGICEGNRLAICASSRSRLIVHTLFHRALIILVQISKTLVLTAPPALAQTYIRFFKLIDSGVLFRYHHLDPEPVCLLYLPPSSFSNVLRHFKQKYGFRAECRPIGKPNHTPGT